MPKRAVNGYAKAWAAVVRVRSIASPARVAAALSTTRLSALTGRPRIPTSARMASSANCRDNAVERNDHNDSTACARASSAPLDVTSGGQVAVSSGSTTARSACTDGWSSECFTPPTKTVANPVTSLPLPATVGTSRSRARRCGCAAPRSTAVASSRSVGSPRTSFATSIADPPPRPRIRSGWAAAATAAPRRPSASCGLGAKSAKTSGRYPSSRATMPVRATAARLATTSTRRGANPATSSGIRCTAPFPVTTSTSFTTSLTTGPPPRTGPATAPDPALR